MTRIERLSHANHIRKNNPLLHRVSVDWVRSLDLQNIVEMVLVREFT